ncbi:MAG: HEAT repeat domain-containing protein [Candidatus Heimdallarchaeaceae archaeon]
MSDSKENSDLEALIKQLKYSSIPLKRERAAYILANFKDSKALEALLNAQLTDPNPRVRDAASQALASLITSEKIEEEFIEEFSSTKENSVSKLFNLSKEFEIIRKGMRKVKFDWKDSLELKQLFNSLEKDRFLKKQPNVKSLINSILLLPIDDSDMGRDIAIAISEILRVSSDEIERLTAIGCLNNIVTNIEKYTPYFGIAESSIMIFKASDDPDMRIAAFKCIEEIIVKRKSLARLNQYTNDVVKLLTFSYDQKIREIALFAYPDLVLSREEPIMYLVDLIIGTVRATYEDRLREMGLKALEALIIGDSLNEDNVQRIIKILKSHHTKNVRTRAIELFTQVFLQIPKEEVEQVVSILFAIVMKTKEEDICYNSLQYLEKYIFSQMDHAQRIIILKAIEDITLKSHHPFLAFRAYSIIESILLNAPKKFTHNFSKVFVESLKLHKDIGVMDQILLALSDLTIHRDLLPSDIKQYIKTILYLTSDPEILEGLINIFKELMLANKNVIAEKVINKLMEIVSKTVVKDDVFLQISQLDEKDFV